MVACKDNRCAAQFTAPESEIELSIHERIIRTNSGKAPLSYFDGATMSRYRIPHKVFETIYCRKLPKPLECKLIDAYDNFARLPVSLLEVKPSSLGENVGNGIFTKGKTTFCSLAYLIFDSKAPTFAHHLYI